MVESEEPKTNAVAKLGAEVIVKDQKNIDPKSGYKVPLVGEMPKPDSRVFENGHVEKPERKLAEMKVSFGELNTKNFEQMRILNYLNLPVIYSEHFYEMLTSYRRYSKFAYFKDILVGAISCKQDTNDEGMKVCYIMTITVLKPYRRYGIGSQLL